MNKKEIKLVTAALVTALGLCACTVNTGVATEPSDSSQAALSSDPQATTVDLSDQSVETVYGTQLPGYLNHQYYFEGNPIPLTESNFYFIDTFTELTTYAGYYYPATADGYIDLAASIDSASATDELSQYQTYGDFFVSYSEQMLESACIIQKRANEEGLVLPEEQLTQIDSVIEQINTSAAQANLTADEYLSIYYGEGTTVDAFRQTITNYYLADLYTQEFIDNYEFDEAEITVPNIRYALFSANEGMTEEEIAAAEANANQVFEEAGGDMDIFAVSGALAFTNGTAADYGEIGVPNDGSIDAVFTEWAWDPERQEGDIELIYSPSFGYFIVGYVGTTEIDQSAKEQLAVSHLSEEISSAIDNNEYEFYTDDPYEPAPAVQTPDVSLPDDIAGTSVTTVADSSSNVGGLTGNKALDVILVVLSVIGGVAVIGLAAVGVMHITGKNKKKDKKEEEE